MSKGRVWNKGKRNGGGGPPVSSKSKDAKGAIPSPEKALPTDGNGGVKNERITTVKRMNRENWVTRPARVAPTNTSQDGNRTNDEPKK